MSDSNKGALSKLNELFTKIKTSSTDAFNKTKLKTNEGIANIKATGNIDLYFNVIIFLLLLIVVTNDLNSDYDNENDPYRKKNIETGKFVVGVVALLLCLGYIIFYTVNNFNSPSWNSYYYISLVLLGFLYGYFILSYYTLFNYVFYVVIAFIVIVGLAIFFNVFSNYIKSFRGISSFFIYLLFYIPCLVSDFVGYILNEFNITSNRVFGLFFIELLLLLLYFYLPTLISMIVIPDGVPIVNGYIYLTSENVYPVGDIVDEFNRQAIVNDTGENTINRNYTLSMWVFLNQYGTNMAAYNKETLIYKNGDGNPKITYYNDSKEDDEIRLDRYRIYFSDHMAEGETENTNYYEFVIPNQKWNNFVFNYRSNYVDFYINGVLERSFYFKDNLSSIENDPKVMTFGSDNGLSGAVANVRYYNYNLTNREIISNYNLLMKKNPPTNNL
tara:strand:+ start:4972 stop:6300 length:1329 start_codon:yes stop_codon:yes gene_type:complete